VGARRVLAVLAFVGVRVRMAYSRNKLALRSRLRNLNLKSQFSVFLRFFEDCGRFVGVNVGLANFFLGQWKGIDENNTVQLKFLF